MRSPGPEWKRSSLNDEGGAPAWILTFGDTMSLILTFFVLLFSFSTMDPRHFVAVSGEVQDAFGVASEVDQSEAQRAPDARSSGESSTTLPEDVSRRQLADALEAMRKASVDGAQSLRVFETYRGVEVLLPADRVFVADSAEISASSSALIALVASVAKGLPKAQRVVVEVPADAGEATTEHAWRLATQRAETLAQRLQDESGLGPARMIPAAAGVRRGQRSVTFLVEATLAGRPGPSRGTP